jgi:hypothetical protein
VRTLNQWRLFTMSFGAYLRKNPWPESANKLYRPSDRHLSAKLVPTFANIGCHVVNATDPYGRILEFLDRSRYFFFQVSPQFYSRGWVDPVPEPLLLRKFGRAGNRTRTSGSLARSSDHWTTEAVSYLRREIKYQAHGPAVRWKLQGFSLGLAACKLARLTALRLRTVLHSCSYWVTGSLD